MKHNPTPVRAGSACPILAAILLLICATAFAQEKGTFTATSDSKIPSEKSIDTSDGISRTGEEVEAVISANMRSVELIYREYLKHKLLNGDGEVELIFAIAPSGEIIKIDILSSTTGNADFDNAIKNKVATWKWKAIKSSDSTQVISPTTWKKQFVFRK